MELLFLLILIAIMAVALGSGYPVAFALPGAAIITISLAAIAGYLFAGNPDAFFHQSGPAAWLSAGVNNLRGVYWVPERDTLIAIPLFIFMGIMLQRSKIAEDLLITMAQLFGSVPGGLGISVVFVGALLAATTGIVGATVVAMGLISLPAMLRNNYSQSLATGTIAASGTLGQIIPPSIVLIILADQLASSADQAGSIRKALHKASTGELTMPSSFEIVSTSAGEMFLGAFLPGLVLVGLYMLYILVYAFFKPENAPAVPYDGKFDARFWGKVFITLIPPLALIFLVLGSIVTGVATVNQAGAIGAAGALIMSGYKLKEGQARAFYPAIIAVISLVAIAFIVSNFNTNIKNIKTGNDELGVLLAVIAVSALIASLIWSGWRAWKTDNTLNGVMLETAKATSLVFIILLGAAMLTAAFRAFGGEELVREFLNSMPGGFWSKFMIVMFVIFILGFFLDFIEIAVVVVPIVAPILLADPSANITAVWLGVMIGLNIQTSFLTPPFGFALFYLRGVAPAVVKTINMYKGVIPFIALQIVALLIVGKLPQLVNYLPNRVALLSETAPPPTNPKLQYCLENYVHEKLITDRNGVLAAISTANTLDLESLPSKLSKQAKGSFKSALAAIDHLDASFEAEQVVETAKADYRPQHTKVRKIEADIRKIEVVIKEEELLASRLRSEEQKPAREEKEKIISVLKAEVAQMGKTIPASWSETYDTFSALTKSESKS
ncbi:MAG: TRAP transporter large permease subunit, partial [Nitratireductor sp.]